MHGPKLFLQVPPYVGFTPSPLPAVGNVRRLSTHQKMNVRNSLIFFSYTPGDIDFINICYDFDVRNDMRQLISLFYSFFFFT